MKVLRVSVGSNSMNVVDAFIYNFLAMGVIFPWVYLWGPAAFPGCNLELAIWLTLLAQIPVALSYCCLACIFPVNGGDYVFQSRTLGRVGAVVVLSGFVAWILQWIALSGVLFTQLGVAPLLMTIACRWNIRGLTVAATLIQSPGGIMVVTLALALAAVLLLRQGLHHFARLQRVLFVLTLVGMICIAWVFGASDRGQLVNNIDTFVCTILTHLHTPVPQGMYHSFIAFTVADVKRNSAHFGHSGSLLSTFAIIPLAWTSLQWSTYSVEHNAQIKGGGRFVNQIFMLIGSAVAVSCVLVLVAHYEQAAFPSGFLDATASAYWGTDPDTLTNSNASPFLASFLLDNFPPYPSTLAIAGSNSTLLAFLIAVGFLANAFQITCNCFIGVSRILVRLSRDKMVPSTLKLHRLNSRHAPERAYWCYLTASTPVVVGYFLVSDWKSYTLGITLACGYVFAISCLALAFVPSSRVARRMVRRSDLRNIPPWVFVSLGVVSFGLCAAMVVSYVALGRYGLINGTSLLVIGLVIVISYVVVVISKTSVDRESVGRPTSFTVKSQ
jgi:amino acid transporter